MQDDMIQNLEPKKVGRLMGITLDAGQGTQDDIDAEIADFLQACLQNTWSPECEETAVWPKAIARLLGAHRAGEPRPLVSLLLDPHSRLATIKEIRKYAKDRAARRSADVEHAVMTTIYFGAIANALVFHDTRITTYSCESLASSFRMLLSKSWMPQTLAELFAKAERVCARGVQEDRPHA